MSDQFSGGAGSLPAQSGQTGKFLKTDGTSTSWATPAGSGTVTNTVGALASGKLVIGNGAADEKTDTGASTDGAGNVTAVSYATSGSNGGIDGTEGTGAGLTAAAGHDILWADSTAHRWKVNSNNGGATTLAQFTDSLSVFAATTSAQLAGVVSDETGSGLLVFATSPTIVTPAIASFTNATHDHSNAAGGGNVSTTAVASGNKTGTGAKFATGTGTYTSGNGVKINAGGDLIDAGSAYAGGGGGVSGYSGASIAFSGTMFFPPWGGGPTSTTETNVDVEAPAAGTITNFYAQLSAALGAGNSAVFTFRKAGADTAITCTISGASATTCNDLTHSFTPTQGDLLSVKVVTTGTVVVTPNVMFAYQFGIAGAAVTSVDGLTGAVTGITQTIASGTSAMGTSAVSSGACAAAVTTSATGTATTDVINWGFNGDPTGVTGYIPATSGMLTIIAYPSANNVNFKVCNNTSASVTPGAVTLNWLVAR